jgi:Iap family predicted aminopeptidase
VIHKRDDYFIAHALLRLDGFGDVYWEAIDRRHFGSDHQGKVKLFYEVVANDHNRVIARKMQDLEIYNSKLKEQGLEEDKPLKKFPALPPQQSTGTCYIFKERG